MVWHKLWLQIPSALNRRLSAFAPENFADVQGSCLLNTSWTSPADCPWICGKPKESTEALQELSLLRVKTSSRGHLLNAHRRWEERLWRRRFQHFLLANSRCDVRAPVLHPLLHIYGLSVVAPSPVDPKLLQSQVISMLAHHMPCL